MNNRWSLGVKLTLFAVIALLFAGMLIAFSGRYHRSEAFDFFDRHNNSRDDSNGKRHYERDFTVKENDNLYVDTDFGDVIVTGSQDNKVHVEVSMRGDGDVISRYPVDFEQDGNTVKVIQQHHGIHFNFFDGENLSATYEISVPNNFNLDVSTAGGEVKIHDVKGDIKGGTSGGDLNVENLDGTIDLSTSGGTVHARKVSGSVDLETSGGDVVIEGGSGTLVTKTSGGNIKITDFDAEVHASTSGGNIKAALFSNKGIRLSTSGGNITLALPDSISGDVEADASGGNVSCDLPFKGKMKDDNMHGRINGGGNKISLETSGGSIEIISRNN